MHAQMLKTVKHFEWPLCYTGSMWSVFLCTLVGFSHHLVTRWQPATFCLLIASMQNELVVWLFNNSVNIVQIKRKIQEIIGVVFFLSRASSSFKSTSYTHYINMSQKDIQKPKSVASWQEAFVPCGCQKWHHNHREGMRWTDGTTTDECILFCSPDCFCFYCQCFLKGSCSLPLSCLTAACTPFNIHL